MPAQERLVRPAVPPDSGAFRRPASGLPARSVGPAVTMPEHTSAGPAATLPARPVPPAGPPLVSARVRAYARLAKLDVFDYYLSLFVAWTLLAPALRSDRHSLGTLGLFLLGEVLLVVGGVAFDDYTGYRDGSDLANYGPDAPARKLSRKPLVTGALQPRQALRFGWLATTAGAAVWATTIALAPHRPLWSVLVAVVIILVVWQYSYGLRLSYHGFQEIFLAALGCAFVLIPYGLAAGRIDGFVLVQALLFGLGPLLFGVYSNTNDIPGDRAVHRPTVAALTGPRGNAVFVAAVSAVELLLVVGAPVLGVAPWWFPVAMLPTLALRISQYVIGFGRGDILRARRLGIHTHRVTVLLLVIVNVVLGLLGGVA